MSDEQRAFRFAMIIEVVLAASNVLSTVVFILTCMIKTPVVTLSSGNVADLRRDFLHGQRVHLQVFIGLMAPMIVAVYYYTLDQDYMDGEESLVKTLYLVEVVILVLQNLSQILLYFSGRMSIKKDEASNLAFITQQTILFWVSYIVIPLLSTALTVVMLTQANKPEMRVTALFLLISVLVNGIWIFFEIRPSFFGGMVPVWQDEVAMLDVVGKRMDKNNIRRR